MAIATDTLLAEHRALTASCGLLDRSERGKLALTGADAKAFLAGQVTNDVEGLGEGAGCYAAFLTHKGKMLGDLRILDTGAELLLDTERVSLQALFDMIRRFKVGFDVELHKRTVQRGLLSLLGPRARAVAGAADLPDRENDHRAGEIAGRAVRLIATDTGVDVLCDAEDTEAVRDALVAAGAVPVAQGSDGAGSIRIPA
ncbi:MAG: amidase family protein, partial [Actinomycetota bacterium]|nr:amidase family protein [Actinomycetota bacterium]